MRIGINGSGLLASPNIDDMVTDVAAAEAEGFSSWWLAQTGLVHALGALAAAGPTTSSIEVGTAVIPTWTQHPFALAGQALTAQQRLGGRLVLGIGLAHKPAVEDRFGMEWHKPVRHMSDYLTILHGLLHDGRAEHRGEIWTFDGETPRPTTDAPKVMLAALGDQMLRLAGRRADGTILWCVGPKTIETHIAPRIRDAAAEADRPEPAIVCSIPCWVTDQPDAARSFIAQILANYATLPSYRAMLDIEGIHGLEDLSLVGSADEVRAGIEAVAAAGATDFTAVPMGNPDEMAETRQVVAEAGRARS